MPRATIIRGGLPASDPIAAGAFSNADLLQISGPGAPDRNGDPGSGAVLWSGEAPGHLARVNSTEIVAGAQTPVRLDVFHIPVSAGAPVLEAAGPDWTATTVTLRDRRTPTSPVTLTFRVDRMEHRAQGTILDHVRLELEHGVQA